jgi:hypothetical protein
MLSQPILFRIFGLCQPEPRPPRWQFSPANSRRSHSNRFKRRIVLNDALLSKPTNRNQNVLRDIGSVFFNVAEPTTNPVGTSTEFHARSTTRLVMHGTMVNLYLWSRVSPLNYAGWLYFIAIISWTEILLRLHAVTSYCHNKALLESADWRMWSLFKFRAGWSMWMKQKMNGNILYREMAPSKRVLGIILSQSSLVWKRYLPFRRCEAENWDPSLPITQLFLGSSWDSPHIWDPPEIPPGRHPASLWPLSWSVITSCFSSFPALIRSLFLQPTWSLSPPATGVSWVSAYCDILNIILQRP